MEDSCAVCGRVHGSDDPGHTTAEADKIVLGLKHKLQLAAEGLKLCLGEMSPDGRVTLLPRQIASLQKLVQVLQNG